MNSLGYSELSQSPPVENIICPSSATYDNTCIQCGSNDSWPIWNMPGSQRKCNTCKGDFNPRRTDNLEWKKSPRRHKA